MNVMIYLRGFPYDFDQWHAMGNEGWDYKTVLEYFKKSEGNKDKEIRKNKMFHSAKGPMKIGSFNSQEESRKIFVDAAKEMGYQLRTDLNAEDRVGYMYVQGTVFKGERQSTAKAYLVPAAGRKNLHVIKYAHVTGLDVDDSGRVTGVNFNYNATNKFVAKAKKEVVLSAGAINTPQILMLSGIGPKAQLKQHKIPVISDLAVGQNLQDHVFVPLFFAFPKNTRYVDATEASKNMFQYMLKRSGPLANTGSIDLVALLDGQNVNGEKPDIEVHHNTVPRKSPIFKAYLNAFGFEDNITKSLFKENDQHMISMVFVGNTNPKSTGEITLRSRDPNDPPKIFPKYFSDTYDLDTIVRGLKIQAKYEDTNAFKENEIRLIKLNLPECDKFEYKSDEYWKCYARMLSTTTYHPTSTAKMGPATDKSAVVDAQLRVRGVSGLRVADASVMPQIVSVNTNAATIMIGERCADFIKQQWQDKDDHSEL